MKRLEFKVRQSYLNERMDVSSAHKSIKLIETARQMLRSYWNEKDFAAISINNVILLPLETAGTLVRTPTKHKKPFVHLTNEPLIYVISIFNKLLCGIHRTGIRNHLKNL